MQQELDLFKLRFLCEKSKDEKKKFLDVNNLKYESVGLHCSHTSQFLAVAYKIF